ncbi:hypothetical protein EJ110_NYTH06934 [Nymphaea thermarum]|nr:hypothetical protein EJ110_NYTH06934 [Nymphaea thermarum]
MNRAMDELPGLLNGSPSIHTSRPIPRSTEKRPSSVSPHKLEKPASSLPFAQANHGSSEITNNHQYDSGAPPITTSELGPDSCAPAPPPASERLNIDLFEWPKIYYSLPKKEKEEELHAVKSSKHPQGPKKRAKLSDKSTSQHPETITTTISNSNNSHNHNNINGTSKNHGIYENSVAAPVGGDVLLQWGHNKRSRGSRSDGGSAQGRQVVKMPRRTGVGGSDKPIQPGHQNHQTASAAGYTRGGNLRPCTPVREAHSRSEAYYLISLVLF